MYWQEELEHADQFLRGEMGLDLKQTTETQLNFSSTEVNQYMRRFKSLDVQNKGFITINDLRAYFLVRHSSSPSACCFLYRLLFPLFPLHLVQ